MRLGLNLKKPKKPVKLGYKKSLIGDSGLPSPHPTPVLKGQSNRETFTQI
jgi:hypothetical protein